jgi:DNA-binding response OmpR family regulator
VTGPLRTCSIWTPSGRRRHDSKRGDEMSKITQKSPIPDVGLPGSDVLIFSSDKGFIEFHRAVLLSIGFVPITAATLDVAFVILRVMVIELAIVDEEAGVPETQRILKRARDDAQNVPVLVISQNSDPELRCQALGLGAVGYLDRPAFQDDIVQAHLAHCTRGGNPLWEAQQN